MSVLRISLQEIDCLTSCHRVLSLFFFLFFSFPSNTVCIHGDGCTDLIFSFWDLFEDVVEESLCFGILKPLVKWFLWIQRKTKKKKNYELQKDYKIWVGWTHFHAFLGKSPYQWATGPYWTQLPHGISWQWVHLFLKTSLWYTDFKAIKFLHSFPLSLNTHNNSLFNKTEHSANLNSSIPSIQQSDGELYAFQEDIRTGFSHYKIYTKISSSIHIHHTLHVKQCFVGTIEEYSTIGIIFFLLLSHIFVAFVWNLFRVEIQRN